MVLLTEGKYEHDDHELELSFGVRTLFGEYVRRNTKKRTSVKMRKYQSKDSRLMSRHPIYGLQVDPSNPKLTVPNVAEQQIIEQIMAMHRAAGDEPN